MRKNEIYRNVFTGDYVTILSYNSAFVEYRKHEPVYIYYEKKEAEILFDFQKPPHIFRACYTKIN